MIHDGENGCSEGQVGAGFGSRSPNPSSPDIHDRLREIEIPISTPSTGVKSLCWEEDHLVDWAGGGQRFFLDGRSEGPQFSYAADCDAAVVSPSGEFAVIYAKLGTKGLVLRRGEIIREIQRFDDNAEAYEYPLALFRLADGQEVIAHCPEDCYLLEIDDLATGKCLCKSVPHQRDELYHSRLALSPSKRFLVSAGWGWHPIDQVQVYDIEHCTCEPSRFDSGEVSPFMKLDIGNPQLTGTDELLADGSSACFTASGRLVVSLTNELKMGEQQTNRVIRVFDLLPEPKQISLIIPQAIVGTIMAIGEECVIGFYEHPKLIDLWTGAILHEWPHLKTGKQESSIIWHLDTIPPLAFDSPKMRFAVAGEKNITVVQLVRGD